jgi:hypothetical protein
VPPVGEAGQHWHGPTAFGSLARFVADAAAALYVCPAVRPESRRGIRRWDRAALAEAVGQLRPEGRMVTCTRPPYPASLGMHFSMPVAGRTIGVLFPSASDRGLLLGLQIVASVGEEPVTLARGAQLEEPKAEVAASIAGLSR